jgi:hypothetical protein
MSDRLFRLEQEIARMRQQSQLGLSEAAAYDDSPQNNRLLALQQSLTSSEFGYGLEFDPGMDTENGDRYINQQQIVQQNRWRQKFAEAKAGEITMSFTQRASRATSELVFKHMTEDELTAEFQDTCKRKTGVQERTTMLTSLPNRGTTTVTWGGVTCNILSDPADKNLDLKKEQLKIALEAFQGQAGFALPQNQLNVYCVTSGTSAWSNMSVGFVYKDPANQPNQLRVALILGDSIGEETSTRLLCDDVHDYYKPTLTVDASKRRAITAIYHEFGHIFHQLQSPIHYFGLANLVKVFNAGTGGYAGHANYNTFPTSPSFATLDGFLTAIKQHGQTVSQYASSHPNEFIAETFSGLMMGVPINADTQGAYQALGGPMPTTGMVHVRTGQNWLKRNVLYPMAKAIASIGE